MCSVVVSRRCRCPRRSPLALCSSPCSSHCCCGVVWPMLEPAGDVSRSEREERAARLSTRDTKAGNNNNSDQSTPRHGAEGGGEDKTRGAEHGESKRQQGTRKHSSTLHNDTSQWRHDGRRTAARCTVHTVQLNNREGSAVRCLALTLCCAFVACPDSNRVLPVTTTHWPRDPPPLSRPDESLHSCTRTVGTRSTRRVATDRCWASRSVREHANSRSRTHACL